MLEELLYKDRILIDGWDKNRSIYLKKTGLILIDTEMILITIIRKMNT